MVVITRFHASAPFISLSKATYKSVGKSKNIDCHIMVEGLIHNATPAWLVNVKSYFVQGILSLACHVKYRKHAKPYVVILRWIPITTCLLAVICLLVLNKLQILNLWTLCPVNSNSLQDRFFLRCVTDILRFTWLPGYLCYLCSKHHSQYVYRRKCHINQP